MTEKRPEDMTVEERREWAMQELWRGEDAGAPEPWAKAGWYPHPDMVATVRYWDGDAWTNHIAPAGSAPTPATVREPAVPKRAAATRSCPYCAEQMAAGATRCQLCSGELRFCSHCKQNVGTISKQKLVGVLRGGMKARVSCMRCGRTLDGPRL